MSGQEEEQRRPSPRSSSVRELIERLYARGTNSSLPTASSRPAAERSRSPHRSVSEELEARFPSTFRRSFPQDRHISHSRLTRRPSARQREPEKGGKPFVRNVFLIPDPSNNYVPKGVDRQRLYEDGYVVNFLELNTAWDEERVASVLSKAFKDVLPPESSSPRYVLLSYNLHGEGAYENA